MSIPNGPPRPGRLLVLALLAAAVLGASAPAAYGRTISLNLKGGYKNATQTACTQTNHYTYYRYRHWNATRGTYVRNKVSMDGFVYPAPPYADGDWRVKIKVKKCTRRNGVWAFRKVWERHALGNHVFVGGVRYGHFRKTFRFPSKGYFFARAYYYRDARPVRSGDEHFRVTR